MTKKTKRKKVKKQSKAIVKKKEEKKLLWAGAQRLMTKPTTQQADRERKIILMTARVLNVSPFGVNILGGQPYINQLGLKEKAMQYDTNAQFKYEWVKVSQDDTDKAICKCKIVSKGKELTDWVVGECSPSSMKMGTLKGYQNHMAQTRARNRAIQEAFGIKIHEEMMQNIEKLYQQKAMTEKQAEKVGSALTTSIEEIQKEKPQTQGTLFVGNEQIERLMKLAREVGAKKNQEKQFIEYITGIRPDWGNMTKVQVSRLETELLNKTVKNHA